jgi:hypothetical protein
MHESRAYKAFNICYVYVISYLGTNIIVKIYKKNLKDVIKIIDY